MFFLEIIIFEKSDFTRLDPGHVPSEIASDGSCFRDGASTRRGDLREGLAVHVKCIPDAFSDLRTALDHCALPDYSAATVLIAATCPRLRQPSLIAAANSSVSD